MSPRAIVITLLGIACGFFAAIGVTQMGAKPQVVEKVEEVPRTDIVVVKVAIDRGKSLPTESLELKPWPKDLVPEGALTNIEDAKGRITMNKLIVGEPLLEGKLAPAGTYRGAGNLVQPGMRAYTIVATNAASSVAGLILPGDRIDIILTVQSMGGEDRSGGTSTTLLQNVEILAIDKNLEAPDSPSAETLTSVTLLVTQRQASLLGLGQKLGTLTMSLRNPEDEDGALTEPVTLAELRLREEPVQPSEPEPVAPELLSPTPDPAVVVAPEPPQAEVVEIAPPAPKKPKFAAIRTMRGSQTGLVSIQLNSGN